MGGLTGDCNDFVRAGGRLDPADSEPYAPPPGNGVKHAQPVEPFATRLLTEPPEPTRWLLEGFLPAGSCAVLAAAPKSGKTWITFGLGISLATGHSLLGWSPQVQGRTLYYSPESGWNARSQRLWGLCDGLGLDPRVVAADLPFLDARLDLSNQEHVDRLAATVGEERPVLLVIDPLVSAHMGLDENAAGDVASVLNPLRDLSLAHPDMSILVCHHTAKAAGERSRALGIRGSSAIDGWRDTLITLVRAGDDPDAPRRVDVDHRDARPPAPVGFHLATGPGWDDDHPWLSWFRLDPCDPPELTKAGPRRGRDLDVDGLLAVFSLVQGHSGALTRRQGATELGWNHNKFNRYFDRLLEQGRVRLNPDSQMEVPS